MSRPSPRRYFDFVRVEMHDPRWTDVQRLRYDVYCLEMKFLEAADYPTGLETDEFDVHSVHFAAVNDEAGTVATLRLVRDGGLGFPLERHAGALHPSFSALPRDKTVEVSRLILARSYRRRVNDMRYGLDIGPDRTVTPLANRPVQRRSPYPLILFGLFRCMFVESTKAGIEYWVAAMEPGLQTFLDRFGFRFVPVGDPLEYYGEVVPYAARIQDIYETVATLRPDVLKVVLGTGD